MDELLAIYLIGMLFPTYTVLYAVLILKEPAEDLKRLQDEGQLVYALLILKCVLERAFIWPLIALIFIVRTIRTYIKIKE